jgi:hypothetical protein
LIVRGERPKTPATTTADAPSSTTIRTARRRSSMVAFVLPSILINVRKHLFDVRHRSI